MGDTLMLHSKGPGLVSLHVLTYRCKSHYGPRPTIIGICVNVGLMKSPTVPYKLNLSDYHYQNALSFLPKPRYHTVHMPSPRPAQTLVKTRTQDIVIACLQ